MRPKKIVVSSVAASPWYPVDYKQDPCNIGISVVITTGPATYTVEHTYDDIYDPTVTPVAFQNSGLTSQTANKDGSYTQPIRAVRLNVSALTAGSVAMTVVQGLR